MKERTEGAGGHTTAYFRFFMFLVVWVRLTGFLMEHNSVWKLKHFLIRVRETTRRLMPTFLLAAGKQHSRGDF